MENSWKSVFCNTASKTSVPCRVLTAAIAICTLVTTQAAADDSSQTWKPWLIEATESYRPDTPPDITATKEELQQLKQSTAVLTDEQKANVEYWQPGAANYRWVEIILERYSKGPPSPLKSRGLALLNAAIYDALVASSHAKEHFERDRPTGITTIGSPPESSSYPSSRAAAAGAAAAVLGYLFPEEARKFTGLAQLAAQARIDSGHNFPSDTNAGLKLGAAVAQSYIAYATTDNSDSQFTGERPTGPDKLQGKVFVYPTAGEWQTWVIDSPDKFTPAPPPAIDSAQMKVELEEIKSIERTVPVAMQGWIYHSVTRAYHWWYERIGRAVFENNLEENLLQSALAYATIAIANQDSIIACFNAKYTYWMIRPAQLDKEVTTLFPSPPHPSYPGAHSCSSKSYAVTFSHFFPTHSSAVHQAAEDAGQSRIIAGIHYQSDKVAGDEIGTAVSKEVIAYAESLVSD